VRALARNLRTASTHAEGLLWNHLRGRRLAGFKFRRQHPVAAFVADFACLEAMVIVELDGSQHFELPATEADRQRTAVLEGVGFAALRFDNRKMLKETRGCAVGHQRFAFATLPSPQPSPAGGRGS
jgi:very-short-patch-repair endonuclease